MKTTAAAGNSHHPADGVPGQAVSGRINQTGLRRCAVATEQAEKRNNPDEISVGGANYPHSQALPGLRRAQCGAETLEVPLYPRNANPVRLSRAHDRASMSGPIV